MDLGFQDKVVLVTGATGGIGRATARAFAQEGARVVLHYRKQPKVAEILRDEIGQDRCIALSADLTVPDQVDLLFEAANGQFGGVDILVNNAGVSLDGVGIIDHTPEQIRHVIATNLEAAMLATTRFFRLVQGRPRDQRSASVVFVSSTAGRVGEPGNAIYAATKAALIGYMQSAAAELAKLVKPPSGRANAILPGWCATELALEFLRQQRAVTGALETRLQPRLATPKNVADAILFLASDEVAGHITGTTLEVSGGMNPRIHWKSNELGDAFALLASQAEVLEGELRRLGRVGKP